MIPSCAMASASRAQAKIGECTICQEGLREGERIAVTACEHTFHPKCLEPWFLNNYPQFSCPNCRERTRPSASPRRVPTQWEDRHDESFHTWPRRNPWNYPLMRQYDVLLFDEYGFPEWLPPRQASCGDMFCFEWRRFFTGIHMGFQSFFGGSACVSFRSRMVYGRGRTIRPPCCAKRELIDANEIVISRTDRSPERS
uniref:RING-type domain-containing protein n=1 Tax=Chromera velia CCMP2878 TaxID=1169474 RepID=A0A0G4IEC6_9ALVE|mmetsp:Transcript_46231/g.91181  ORF Transcript_46231/g.91181 Transcript_46231/m.91181 type:complete len:198 (-) Transcript_46231:1348-1941(-)|eukprot:Cvel_13545.t1-p1 / transcript=Cvel_13545.t1 / gene=Cvel_13545 / organism=Chromera_velia_CCMP2878 / gene_product=E3 ubiquitin-protein ligase ZNRF3, putative / transcript_product=E3 ubiquitin-protein ligase ZNRF3, putative / location=Cvel_scaffold930:22466-23150(-) / protein_length=197 / sequence_SO=supercontig / SO=protein_coding / is_pseudo=false